MIERVEACCGIRPERLIGDTAYGMASMLGWLVQDKAITPHIPVWDKSKRQDLTLARHDFQWDEQANEYRCPAGKPLRSRQGNFKQPRSEITKANTIIYRASQQDGKACHLKARCCPNTTFRLRGMSGARDEFLLAATAQNLRRMAKLMSKPPPDHRISVPA